MGVRPNLVFTLLEPRAFLEFGSFVATGPLLRRAPKGDGHAVMVFPGFMASDVSTSALRSFLRDLGYEVYGWDLGQNIGPTVEAVSGMRTAVRRLSKRSGPISVIGWSLGGVYARYLALENPAVFRQVITLASPFGLTDPRHSRASAIYDLMRPEHSPWLPQFPPLGTLRVPSTAVYTKTDGVVPWWSCVQQPGPIAENVEVRGSHFGLGHNPAVGYLIADRMATGPGEWEPFRPPRAARAFYPSSHARRPRALRRQQQ